MLLYISILRYGEGRNGVIQRLILIAKCRQITRYIRIEKTLKYTDRLIHIADGQ